MVWCSMACFNVFCVVGGVLICLCVLCVIYCASLFGLGVVLLLCVCARFVLCFACGLCVIACGL